MVLCKWEELPEFMRIEEIRHYYLLLSRRQPELVLKRIFDFTVSSVMLALFAPLFYVWRLWSNAIPKARFFIRRRE